MCGRMALKAPRHTPPRPRRSRDSVLEALSDTRVVVIVGARQVGKSTLARLVAADLKDVSERRLDVPAVLDAALRDPIGLVEHDGVMLIDEVQRAPRLLLAIKDRVDRDPRPGRFLLTGSAQVRAVPNVRDALTGRNETIELWPFSQGEIDGAPDGLLAQLFDSEDLAAVVAEGAEGKQSYLARVLRGGFPEAVARAETRRAAFFASYLTDLIDRDIKELRAIRRTRDLRLLVRLLAMHCAQPFVTQHVASTLGVPRKTIDDYVDLLEAVYLVRRVPGWSHGAARRAVTRPKLVFVDSGIAAHLAGMNRARLSSLPAHAGGLVENFVLGELERQIGWSPERIELMHYRTRDGLEVDGVLEAADGRVVGIEIKASSTVGPNDFRAFNHFQRVVGDDFVRGVVFYTGSEVLRFGPTFFALPLDALWRTPAP